MKLKAVKVLGNGFGGLLITYLTQGEKNGRLFGKEVKEKNKQPIHLGLENKFKELRPFLLDLCKVLRGDEDKTAKDFLIQETEMTGLQIVIDTTADEGTGFILEGSSVVLGTKEVKFKTPKIESGDNYQNFDAVQLIIKEIITEVQAYMSGSVIVNDEEVLIRWMERNKEKEGNGIDIETIKNMSPDEQKELLSGILEKRFGCVVLSNEDLVAESETDISEDLIEGAENNIKEESFIISDDTNIIPMTKVLQPDLIKKAK